MLSLISLKFKYWNPIGITKQLIGDWCPPECKTEKEYESSLYNFLHDSLPELIITAQYAYGRAVADIVIAEKVAIEIKKDLNKTSEFQRLIGQAHQFKYWPGSFFILLIGKTDSNLRDELKKQMNDINRNTRGYDQKISIVDKK
ncbi:MAG: hypothetical protein P4L35_01415 [Ignavibacteriaceae bacterium]|nr:hypothetical protein [Ignavibacteriaceae bacterium]